MTRVSQLELYNDKDVITQICMMKQMVETGTYREVRVTASGPNYVFEFEDQNGDVQTFTVPAKQISGVTSSQSGSTVTMRVNYNDGTYTNLSWTAGGDVTTNTAQTISAVKTFTASPIVPTTPNGTTSAVNQAYVESTVDGVNNLVHKSGNENISSRKIFNIAEGGTVQGANVAIAPTGEAKFVQLFKGTPSSQYCEGLLYYAINRGTGTLGRRNARGLLAYSLNKNGDSVLMWLIKGSSVNVSDWIVTNENGEMAIWTSVSGSSADVIHTVKLTEESTNGCSNWIAPSADTTPYEIDSTGYTDSDGVVHTFNYYNPSIELGE